MTYLKGSVLGRVVAGLSIRGVSVTEGVRCECADSECSCHSACGGRACYEWGRVDEDDWQFLCHRCAVRLVERGTPPQRDAVVGPPGDEEGDDAGRT